MKKVLAVVLAAAFVSLTAFGAYAQPVPNVQWFFDENTTMTAMDCPGTGANPATGYIVAVNFNQFFSSLDYTVAYPPSIMWLADLPVDPIHQLNIGTTPGGIASAWNLPQNGFAPIKVLKVLFNWNCDDCYSAQNQPIVVGPYPGQPSVRFVRWPDNVVFDAVGMTSLVCPGVVPVEETNWGQIKALYEN
jgi:hypothetical protein